MFKEHIDHQILRYPSLSLNNTYEKSEAMALNQIFFVIGNGYEWMNGYPLSFSGRHHLVDYKPVDIDYFFKMKNKIYALDIDGEKTKDYIKDMNIPIMNEYSNDQYLYTMDTKFINYYNKMVVKDYPNQETFDLFDRVEKFEKISNFIFDVVILSPINENYSMITEITKQDKIVSETIQYGLKMLDYAEKLYTGCFGIKSFERAKKNNIDPNKELKKIYKLRTKLNEYI